MLNLHPGDRQQISIGDTSILATIKTVSEYKVDQTSGAFVVYEIPGYGETQPFWVDENTSYAQMRRDRSGMPKEYTYKRGKDFQWDYYGGDTAPQKSIANAFISRYEEFRRSGRGLYIYSSTKGSGKTLLACCLANEVMERYNAVVKFVQVLDYVDLVKRKDEAAEEERINLRRCSLLILDDIGVQTDKQEWINNALFSLIDERYRNLLPTIYTSNVPMERASKDDRIQSRVYGTSIPMMLPEVSIREKLADRYTAEFLKTVLN